LQSHDQNKLYRLLPNFVPSGIIKRKNKAKTWEYGYNEKYDIVVISKDGTIGDVYEISGVRIALPATPKILYNSREK